MKIKTILFVLFLLFTLFILGKWGIKKLNIIALKNTFQAVTQLQGTQNFDDLYQHLSPAIKENLTKNDYLNRMSQYLKPKSWNTTIKSVAVNGDRGTVDASTKWCFKNHCSVDSGKTYFVKVYGIWYINDSISCDRTTPYDNLEEFNRAVSLIIQRYSESQRAEDREFGKGFKEIRNCLDIRYARTNEEMNNAEGLFLFAKDSLDDRLLIYVSPDYKVTDDLVTAELLVHEMYHALIHSSHEDIFIPCLENETSAFIMSYNFGFILKEEEKESIATRLQLGTSEQIYKNYMTYNLILKMPGKDIREQFLNFVKSNPDYLKQCKNSD